jgi:hypothetical protein
MAEGIIVNLTDVAIKLEGLIARSEERDRLYTERTVAAELALKAASVELDKRLNSMNEWRQTLQDRDKSYLLTAVFDKQHDALAQRVDKIERLIYIMVGGVMLLEVLVPVILHYMPTPFK